MSADVRVRVIGFLVPVFAFIYGQIYLVKSLLPSFIVVPPVIKVQHFFVQFPFSISEALFLALTFLPIE
jgi:hypothetical protein